MADKQQFMPKAREAYDRGASVTALKRRFSMSRSELQDVCPEEFEDRPTPENAIGGY